MDHHHLLPNEIDLIVDGTAGADLVPLRAHLAECGECRDRYDELRIVSEAVEAVPHFVPRLRFADSVMAGVQVTEPWHVGVTESARRLVPTSRPMRTLGLVGVSITALAVSGTVAVLALRGDLGGWVLSVLVDRTRQGVLAGAREVANGALGADGTATLASGGFRTIALMVALLTLTAIGAVVGFRRLAATAASKRN